MNDDAASFEVFAPTGGGVRGLWLAEGYSAYEAQERKKGFAYLIMSCLGIANLED